MNFLRRLQASSPELLLGGRYQLIEQLGAGGFGQTFLATDRHLPGHPRCVIKQLKPQATDVQTLQIARRLFDTEAKVLYELGHHDQIPRLLAHFEHQEEFYLAQELIVGEPFSQELARGESWNEAQVVALLQDILQVLSFVHDQNVIHRDIKPANLIRRAGDGKIILIDFGAVKQVTTRIANPDANPTQTISIGTLGYMPNEQIAGNPRFSSDIYAVGMVAIQALTGIPPKSLIEDPYTSEILWQTHAPEVNPQLVEVLDKMVRYDFRARYPTAREALADVEALPIRPAERVLPPPPVDLSAETVISSQPTPAPSVSGTQPTLAVGQIPQRRANLDNTTQPPVHSRTTTIPVQGAPSLRDAIRSPALVPATLLSHWKQTDSRKLFAPAAGVVAMGLLLAWGTWFKAPSSAPESSPGVPVASAPSTPTAPSTPASPPAWTQQLAEADQARENQQFQQALDQYDQVIAANPQAVEAHWGRCFSLNSLGQPTEAIASCDAALALKPDYPEALWSKGYALDLQQNPAEALAFYEQAIALNPDFAEAWSNKGAALLRLERPQDAVAALDRATSLDPTLAEAWNNRGAALWSLRRFDEAVTSVEEAIKLQPDYQDALSLRQQMKERLGR